MEKAFKIILITSIIVMIIITIAVFFIISKSNKNANLLNKNSENSNNSDNSDNEENEYLVTKDFGSYMMSNDWPENVENSTYNKFFYIKKGDENKNRPNNISINSGKNKYSSEMHEKFKYAILAQLSRQLNNDSDSTLDASGSYTKNGYILYTFIIKDEKSTTTQYYIIGDYKYILIQETLYENSDEIDSVAQEMVDSFKWN